MQAALAKRGVKGLLRDRAVAKALQLTSDQENKVKVASASIKARVEGQLVMPRNRVDVEVKRRTALLQGMTPKQRAAWNTMLGKPLYFDPQARVAETRIRERLQEEVR